MHLAACFSNITARASAQSPPLITEVRVEQESRTVDDRLISGLIETTVGEPLSMRKVRETLTHLTSLNRYEDIQVLQEPAGAGIRLRYVLVPLHPVDRMEFRGTLGLPEGEVRRVVTERFGAAPSAGRAQEVADALQLLYRERGYTAARVTPGIEETHAPDRATMAFDIQSGPRATIGRLDIDEIDAADRRLPPGDIEVRAGDPYDGTEILEALNRYVASLRGRGFYEARALHTGVFETNGTATVRVTVDRGPLVTVAFAGDPLPEADRERLVPVRAEGSADEDLLEDAVLAIEDYLRARGYRDALTEYARAERDGMLMITFTINRGTRFLVDNVAITGNTAVPTVELLKLVPIATEQPFVQTAAGRAATAMRDLYRSRGFTRAAVQDSVMELSRDGEGAADHRVALRFNVAEGPAALVSSVAFEGHTVLTDAQLQALMTTGPGRPYSEIDVVTARDRIDLEYRNRGYESVVVEPDVSLAENGTRADIRFAIVEGPQVIVDHVIIVGNERTSVETIQRELLLRPGEPLGYSARIESQQRLAALGLFRRVVIEELRHAGESRRDVLIQVEEAPPTTIGYGGGIEGGTRLRPTGEGGQAEERFELAPRGFFEIGRRNLWGKNRAVNLFGRVSLRSRDIVLSDTGLRLAELATQSGYGFNEYRIVSTFSEPRILGSGANLLVMGILEQAIRSSFNFIRRQARGEVALRVTPRYSAAALYAFERAELFDERFTDDEKPLIDRLFPQVRLSTFSGSLLRDTRTDIANTEGGSFIVLTTDLAARIIGSEVGFIKNYLQAFKYVRLPATRRTVLALGGRLGAAHGFPRNVDGVTVQDLPASKRFFAGGDTTVRGFSLDRLGTASTISPSGFPTGGNGLVIVNAELRVGLFGAFDGVTFFDAGNVYARARNIDLTDLRPAAGVGVHYRSAIGPIRVELGFNLDRRELVPGVLERRSVLHISLGQAF
ncbi:MAG: POTRA domain-containing protein [Vicinamibacterales bacterium]